jgi:hypothetical protein
MRLLEHFGATQIEAATCILVASIFELGVLMNRTIGVVADSFHPKLDEASVLLGDIARHDRALGCSKSHRISWVFGPPRRIEWRAKLKRA